MYDRVLLTILTMGSRGDVEPYVSLGRGIAASGYRVRIATLAPFQGLVRSQGLEFRPVPDPLAEFKSSPGWVEWQSSGPTWWRKLSGLRRVLRDARPALLRAFDECSAACEASAAVLSAWTAFGGQLIADRLGAFHARTLLQPVTPTRDYPHFLWPWLGWGLRAVNRTTYPLVEAALGELLGGALNEWRRGRRVRTTGRRAPVIYGFSEAVLHRPADWPPDVHVAGYWWLDPEPDWKPPDELAGFVRDGADVVCVCHGGTFRPAEEKAALELVRRGAEAAGCRVLLVSGAGDGAAWVSPKSLAVNFAPYHWLFRRVGLVVHHGGAGTSAAVLRAGRPSVVLPACFDQPFWARAVERLGAAPAALPPSLLTEAAVEKAVGEAIANPAYRRNALRCAARLAGENGVDTAVGILRRYLPAV